MVLAVPLWAQLEVGKWRDHLSFSTLKQVVPAGERIYGVAAGGLFYYDTEDGTLNKMSKTTVLNDVGVSRVAYDDATGYLVVAYDNANLDLVKGDVVYNLSDIKRNEIPGSKQINNIRFYNGCAYLACGFGIVVVDLARHEIKETYYIGTDGTYKNINDIAFRGSDIVAATDDGLMSADKDNPYLNIVTNWQADVSSLLAGQRVLLLDCDAQGQLLALALGAGDDEPTLFRESGTMAFAPWFADDVRSVHCQTVDGAARTVVSRWRKVEIYDADYQLLTTIGTVDWMGMQAHDARLTAGGTLWVAHNWAGLARMALADPAATLSVMQPQGPLSDNVYKLVSWDDDMMVCPGGHTPTYTGAYISADLFTYNKNRWSQLNRDNVLLNGIFDVVDVAAHPYDAQRRTAAAWGSGLLEIEGNEVVAVYNENNSDGALVPYSDGSYTTLRTGAVAYDIQGNLWATISLQTNGLAVHRTDGTWQSFNTHDMVNGSEVDHLMCDSIYGNKLFWGRANRIFVHDGENKMAYIDPNQGSKLETSSVNCLAQDHSGNFWMGTNKGIKVIYDLYRVFENGGNGEKAPTACSNIVFNQNGINEYLLAYEKVTCIAVDGGNRKWVGTASGGLYLLSANGLEELAHFTAANSPLFSDKIVSISIMPWTGEVFVGTEKGLQSYRGTATYAYREPQSEIRVFPNPVRPDYDGPIAITGFTRNGIVHVTDAAGHTVYSTMAQGGEAIWNGRTNSGERVGSGVYFVFASAADGKMRSVAKVLIVR